MTGSRSKCRFSPLKKGKQLFPWEIQLPMREKALTPEMSKKLRPSLLVNFLLKSIYLFVYQGYYSLQDC